jgi:predicted DNA-binding transcriptional regulator AlpA
MSEKRFYNIEEMSILLGKSIAAIHGHLARKQYDAVPPPMKLGRRLAWLVSAVDVWIEAKSVHVARQIEAYKEYMQAPARRRGRPPKAEERTKGQSGK